MKPCLTCTHCIRDVYDMSNSRCRLVQRDDLVTGDRKNALCDTTRWAGNICGPDGDKWEAAQTLIAAE